MSEKPLVMTVYACYATGSGTIACLYTVDKGMAEWYIAHNDGARYEERYVRVRDWVRLVQ